MSDMTLNCSIYGTGTISWLILDFTLSNGINNII